MPNIQYQGLLGRQSNVGRQGLTRFQRLAGMGANMLFPGGGLATNAIFGYMNNRNQGNSYTGGQLGSAAPMTGYSPVSDFQQNIPSYTDNLNGANLGFPAATAASQPAAQQPTNAASNAAGALGQAGMRGAGAPTPVNARGRTPQQEAEYAAALQFQAQMAVNRYSQDIGLQNYFSAGPEER